MDDEISRLLNNFIIKNQTTFKIWASTHRAIQICSAITGESMCAFINRLVIAELKKLLNKQEL